MFKGSHMLRHSLATNLLRRGASLLEIGQLLRHSQPATTQIYAKVDIAALRNRASLAGGTHEPVASDPRRVSFRPSRARQ